MKKELIEQIEEFKKREVSLLLELKDYPNNEEVNARMAQFMLQKKAWLETIGGALGNLSPANRKKLVGLVSAAEKEMTRAAKMNASLIVFIEDSAHDPSLTMNGYDQIIEDNSQLEALYDEAVRKKVNALDKFNKKQNKKSFVGVDVCKFRKSKTQEQESTRRESGLQK